jgi:hypothetical protein
MSESDLETSIDCSKRYQTLNLNLTSNSDIDVGPFDSTSFNENEEHHEEEKESGAYNKKEKENQNQNQGKKGKESFNISSYVLSLHQPSEHSACAGNSSGMMEREERDRTSTSAAPGPLPLGTQNPNIILAYGESNDHIETIRNYKHELAKYSDITTKLCQSLKMTTEEKEFLEAEMGKLTRAVSSLI